MLGSKTFLRNENFSRNCTTSNEWGHKHEIGKLAMKIRHLILHFFNFSFLFSIFSPPCTYLFSYNLATIDILHMFKYSVSNPKLKFCNLVSRPWSKEGYFENYLINYESDMYYGHKDHSEVCLPNSKLLSGLIRM